jgi:catechol 2,3-dioxygenase-like lactoylglutathione lyase family enzyme
MIFGRFLEISISTQDIRASVQFYEQLGFSQLTTGDIWSHPYGVLTDGRLIIGLHARSAAPVTLTFVRPQLARYLPVLQAAGFEAHYTRLGDEDFHEAHLRDPCGQPITLLEARTYSPGLPDERALESLCGYFSAYSMPVTDTDATLAFWEHAGWVPLDAEEEPYPHLTLTADALNLELHRPRTLETAALVFRDPQMPDRIQRLRDQERVFATGLPRGLSAESSALLRAPEGTTLLLLTDP